MTIGEINQNGSFSLIFDQKMIIPETIVQSSYASLFKFSLTSNIDGTIAEGRFLNESVSPTRMLEDEDNEMMGEL